MADWQTGGQPDDKDEDPRGERAMRFLAAGMPHVGAQPLMMSLSPTPSGQPFSARIAGVGPSGNVEVVGPGDPQAVLARQVLAKHALDMMNNYDPYARMRWQQAYDLSRSAEKRGENDLATDAGYRADGEAIDDRWQQWHGGQDGGQGEWFAGRAMTRNRRP